MDYVSIPTGQKEIFDKISTLPKHELLDDRSSSDWGWGAMEGGGSAGDVCVILKGSDHFFMKRFKLGLRLSHGPAEI